MEIFEVLEHPIWIKNSKNKVLFINSSFKNTFNLNENFNYDILIKHLNDKDEYAELLKTIVNEKSSNSNSFTYKNKSYKYKIY